MHHTPHISRSSPKAESSPFREEEKFSEQTGGKWWWLEAKEELTGANSLCRVTLDLKRR